MKITLKNNKLSKKLSIHQLEDIMHCIRSGSFGLADAITSIRSLKANDRFEEADAIKGKLPAILMGEYHDLNGGVAQDKAMTHNGIMVFDVDHIGEVVSEALRKQLLSSPIGECIAFTFISPSGGLKVGFQTNYHHYDHDPDLYTYCYKKIFKLFVRLGAPEDDLDGQTCNFNRLTYLSHDAGATINDKARAMPLGRFREEYATLAAEEERKATQRRMAAQTGTHNSGRALAYCIKATDAIIAEMRSGERHKKVYRICMTAFSCGLGIEGAIDMLYRVKAAGQYTETVSPESRARAAHKSFDGVIDKQFNDCSIEDHRQLAGRSLAAILAQAA